MSELDTGDALDDPFSLLLPLPYRIAVVLVLGVWLWGVNLHVLHLHSIDLPSLIRYKSHSEAPHVSVYRFATALSAPVAASILLYVTTTHGGLLPNITLILLLALFVLPHRFLYPKSLWPSAGRQALLGTLGRVSIGGLARTEDGKFGDVLLADALTSYARPLSELYIAFSMMWTRPSSPSHVDRSSIIVVPILLAYPFAIRLRQCITDSQPLNALKYATAFPAIALSTLMRAEKPFIGTGTLHQLWLVAAGINALYSFYWDVARDWDLTLFSPAQRASPDHPYGLRRQRYFKTDPYYAMIAVDLLLRFAWALKLSPHLEHFYDIEGGIFLLELLEVFRRFLWVFFRVETEAIRMKASSDVLLDDIGLETYAD